MEHSIGGMYRIPQTLHSSRFLNLDDRCEIARLRDAGLTVRQVADRLGRAPSTISRELRRNVRVRTASQEPARGDRLSWERRRRPKPALLSEAPPNCVEPRNRRNCRSHRSCGRRCRPCSRNGIPRMGVRSTWVGTPRQFRNERGSSRRSWVVGVIPGRLAGLRCADVGPGASRSVFTAK